MRENMKKLLLYGIGIALLSCPSLVVARDFVPTALPVFESYVDVVPDVIRPTVIEVPVSDPSFRRGDFVVYEQTTETFQPSLYREKFVADPVAASFSADVAPDMGYVAALSDESSAVSVEFPVNADTTVERTVHLSAQVNREIMATGFVLHLDPFVALPRSVEVSAVNADGSSRIVLAKTAVMSEVIRFPKTTSSRFVIALSYIQPLRINEISFFDDTTIRSDVRSIRLLARPGERYRIYFRSDQAFSAPVGESANLSDDRDVQRVFPSGVKENVLFRPVDTDNDGIPNKQDNCVRDANPDQADENRNGLGDVCDDYDRDGIVNSKDNCSSHPNRNQIDMDHDGKGDACDGEESRFMVKYAWVPWVAMALGVIIVSSLFVFTLRGTKDNS